MVQKMINLFHQMPIKSALLVIATLLFNVPIHAQNAQRELVNFAQQNGVVTINTNDGAYVIKSYSDQIIETTFIPQGQSQQHQSHAVIRAPQTRDFVITEQDNGVNIATQGIQIALTKKPFKIEYWYRGKSLISENLGYVKDERGETLSFNLDDQEALYGAGARAAGFNRRGNRFVLYNKAHYGYEDKSMQMNFAMPMVLSSKQYAIHFDNAAIGALDFDSKHNNLLTYETVSGRKTYQVIAGDNWAQILSNYTALTGTQPTPPRWALGNFASRFGYHTEAEARSIVAQFKAEQIPLDAIIFDLYWFGKDIKGTMGNLEFDRDNFPHPAKMIADFKKEGIKTILITEPFILTTSSKWDEAVSKKILATNQQGEPYAYDFYFGHTGLIDVFKPQAREWFWDVYQKYINMGVAGWWGDLGEPEVHPSDMQHYGATADEVHNIYGQRWAQMVADGYAQHVPKQRPFILMRAGYSGAQHQGMIPWSGDVNRTWGGLQSQPEIALQMGMQGMAYMHSDLGGFAGDNLDDELYVRWLQYGVFQPIFRPHAQEEVAAEAVLRAPAAKQLAKQAIQLRYQLLPYNYTLALENSVTGMPLMRPLLFEEPHNRALYNDASSYLWGNDLLVKPVLAAQLKSTSVYFPATANWFDFYDDTFYLAGTTQQIALTEQHIPVFVRAGAFIAMTDIVQNTEQYSANAIKLHYYHAPSVLSGNGRMFDDDGKTPNSWQQDAVAALTFKSEFTPAKNSATAHQLRLLLSETDGANYPKTNRKITLIVHNITQRPKAVSLQTSTGLEPLAFEWDSAKKWLVAHVELNNKLAVKKNIEVIIATP